MAAPRSGAQPRDMAANDEFAQHMEQLRKRCSRRGGAVARPGGQLRKSASASGSSQVAPSSPIPRAAIDHDINRMAVESVHSGVVVALDQDCRAYRAEISQLKNLVARLKDNMRRLLAFFPLLDCPVVRTVTEQGTATRRHEAHQRRRLRGRAVGAGGGPPAGHT